MAIQRLGTLPVAAANVGLAAAVPCLNAQMGKLQLDVSKLQASLLAQLEVTAAFPPDPSFLAALQGALDPDQASLLIREGVSIRKARC